MNTLSLKSALRLINVLVLVVLLVVVGVGAVGLRQVSRSANQMGLGKDVVADILPPPLFLIEAQLTAYDLASSGTADRPTLLKKLADLHKDYNDRNQFWTSLEFDTQVKSTLLGEQKTQGDLFWKEIDGQFLPALNNGDETKMAESLKQVRDHYEAHKKGVAETVIVGNTFAERALASLIHSSQTDTWLMYAVGGFGVAAIFFLMQALNRWLLSVLGGEPSVVATITRTISEGHLDQSIPVRDGDKSSALAACKLMQEKLKDTIGRIATEARSVASSASQLSEAAHQVAASSAHQAQSASSAAAAVDELTVSIDHVSGNADEAHRLAMDAREAASSSSTEMQSASLEVERVALSVDESALSIHELSEQIQQIGKVTTVIRDIADQTNLLALNAAIEAARAGETGRGFAVVADEVRKLAERTTQSVHEISGMIASVQVGAKNAVDSMLASKINVTNVVSTAGNATNSMENIQAAATSVKEAVVSISGALREQGTASIDLAKNVESIAQMSEQNMAAIKSVASTAKSLAFSSEKLQTEVLFFRV